MPRAWSVPAVQTESRPPVSMVSHHAEAVGRWHQLLDGYQTRGGRGQQEG
jgi:hypothetical protein